MIMFAIATGPKGVASAVATTSPASSATMPRLSPATSAQSVARCGQPAARDRRSAASM